MADRSQFMDGEQRARLGHGARRLHHVCKTATGVARPGKTAKDRARREGKG